MKETFYITTPIFYANASPHMGHAYALVLADFIARYHRGRGDDTYFLTGTDEHGIKNLRAAEAAGKEPLVFLDEQAEKFRELADLTNISHDQFIRTTDRKVHWPGAIALWNKLAEAGDIYKGTYEGLYCVGCEAFKTEAELVDGKCPDHDRVPERLSQENYFFKLSKYTNQIKKLIESDELEVLPRTRKNEILALVERGLEDVSFSRPAKDLPWGIPVPGDESQVMYVWCDALPNYISALGYGSDNEELFAKFWPANLHVLGKDILRFHAALWPGMLLSAGLPVPKKILVHGLIQSGGRKMSKTIGNVIDPKEYISEFGVDAFRFYLAHEINPFEDGDFTREKFEEVYNAQLVNGVGNLASRIMKMASSYLAAPVGLKDLASYSIPEYHEAFGRFDTLGAIRAATAFISELDREIQETQPFKVFKTDPEKAKEIVTGLVHGLYKVTIALKPFIPGTAEKIEEAIKANQPLQPLFPRK